MILQYILFHLADVHSLLLAGSLQSADGNFFFATSAETKSTASPAARGSSVRPAERRSYRRRTFLRPARPSSRPSVPAAVRPSSQPISRPSRKPYLQPAGGVHRQLLRQQRLVHAADRWNCVGGAFAHLFGGLLHVEEHM